MKWVICFFACALLSIPAQGDDVLTPGKQMDARGQLACQEFTQIRTILETGVQNGFSASAEQFRRFNEKLGADGLPLCVVYASDDLVPGFTVVKEAGQVESVEISDDGIRATVRIIEVADSRNRHLFMTSLEEDSILAPTPPYEPFTLTEKGINI